MVLHIYLGVRTRNKYSYRHVDRSRTLDLFASFNLKYLWFETESDRDSTHKFYLSLSYRTLFPIYFHYVALREMVISESNRFDSSIAFSSTPSSSSSNYSSFFFF